MDSRALLSDFKHDLHGLKDRITDLRQEIQQANPDI
jgi:hypothetical protein